jgi:long-chain acyl-CoA synthetase
MHPSHHAVTHPDKIAFRIEPDGERVTYAQLDARSNQGAHLFRSLGLIRGDAVSVLMTNHPRYFEVTWAADRSGLYYTCISSRLTVGEAAYIIEDSGSQVLIASSDLAPLARAIAKALPELIVLIVGDQVPPFESYEVARAKFPITPIPDESRGGSMLYSSGTTGRPKGVKTALPDGPIDGEDGLTTLAVSQFGFGRDMVHITPAPLYHSMPLRYSMVVQKLGGTVVVMDKFDAATLLDLIQSQKVTHAACVPTHFVRMLKLPEAQRTGRDLSALKLCYHAAAPCPVPVKAAMIDWWGPIIHEFYAGTEFNGLTAITPQEWLGHKGSVGQAKFGQIHIIGEAGEVLGTRQEGLVYFEGGGQFAYHNDPAKTAEAYDGRGWSTLGDVGWLDEEGYLYLTDRKSFMIISGGVNIYPQEIEDLLVSDPRVADAAVIGAPDDDMGERVVAVVQPADMAEAGPALAAALTAMLRTRLSSVKVPRQIDFTAELPRHPTGKLYKRLIRDQYWSGADQALKPETGLP